MYLREAFMKTLDEMFENGEIEKCVKAPEFKTDMKGRKYGFFRKRKEKKEMEEFIRSYKSSKEGHGVPHWIPTVYFMPAEIMRDVISIMACNYECVDIKEKKEDNKENEQN